jgi:AraC-like DNA-binding protein
MSFSNPPHALFEIQSLDRVLANQPPGAVALRSRLYCYTLLLVEDGQPSAATAHPTVPEVHTLYFLSPGQLSSAVLPPTARGLGIRFSDEFFCLTGDDKDLLLNFGLFQGAALGQPLAVSARQHPEMLFLVTQLQQEFAGNERLRAPLLRAYLKALLIFCIRRRQEQTPGESEPTHPGLFTRFRVLLELHYTELKTVQQYAQRLHVTANHLSETIKKETGLPARDHIRHRITLEAQRLAYFSNLSLKEISYQLGYEDAAHFSKFFKRCNGVSFLKFKEQTRLG